MCIRSKLCLLALGLSCQAHAIPTHIEPGPARLSLLSWSRQTGMQFLYSYDRLDGIETARVDCDCSPQESLALLLQGTGFIGVVTNERAMNVDPQAPELPDPREVDSWLSIYFSPARSYGTERNIPAHKLTVVMPDAM